MPPKFPSASKTVAADSAALAAAESRQAQQPAQQTAPVQRAGAPARGLPPSAPPAEDWDEGRAGEGRGNFRKRPETEEEWREFPLAAGVHHLVAHVTEILEWGPDGAVVKFRCVDWPQGQRFSNENHGRPLRWEQLPSERVTSDPNLYSYWRADLVRCYQGCGWPEEKWSKGQPLPDGSGTIVPPYDVFFVHQVGQRSVPVMLRLTVEVWAGQERWPKFRKVALLEGPVQAPLPRRVTPAIADLHKWRVEKRTLISCPASDRRGTPAFEVDVAVLDKDALAVPVVSGMRTWRDL